MADQKIPREYNDFFDPDLDISEELVPALDELNDYAEDDNTIFWDNMIFPI